MARDKTTQEILDTFDVDPTTLKRWLKSGLPHTKVGKSKNGKNFFDEQEVAAWRKARGLTGEVGRPIPGLTGTQAERLASAKLRNLEALADLSEIKRDKERGVLIEKAEAEKSNATKFTVIRNKLLGLPAAAPSLTGLDAPAIERELETRIREILTELSQA